MAARRGKSQARRNGGNSGGLPGWAWLVLGVVITIIIVMVAPKLLKGDGDGFLRPHANPDAQPTPVALEDDELLPSDTSTTTRPTDATAKPAGADAKNPEYDFYTLLPGKEVPMTDAELAATERAETERQARQQGATATQAAAPPVTTAAQPAGTPVTPTSAPASRGESLPAPVSDDTAERTATAPKPSEPGTTGAKPTASSDDTRYLLQAGAFQASGQAEELKAKIAMLGLGARVESAQIKGQTVYRVRMGPYGTASDLAEAKRKLSSGGMTAMAIKVE
jgi:cell division protein FtsN